MNDDDAFGLSSANRSYIVSIVFAILLLFGPVEPYGLAVRLLYLIALPGALWLVLRFAGGFFNFDAHTNDRINRALTAGLAGALTAGAYLEATASYHTECTLYARTRDGGRECVGDTVTAAGPDMVNAFMLVLIAGFAFWFAVRRPD